MITMRKHVVIVGASITGINVMNTLVKNNFEGTITLLEEHDTFPYNPYKLSKEWMLDLEKTTPPLLKKETYYENHQIDLRLNTEVLDFDPEQKEVRLNDGSTLSYDVLVLSMGSKLNTLNEMAVNLRYLRSFNSALEIKTLAKTAKNITLIGGGFISLELASSFSQLHKNVTVLIRDTKPLEKVFGSKVADYILKMHESHGVNFITEDEAETFEKEDDMITRIITKNKRVIDTDLVIAAIGVRPNLNFKQKDLGTHDLIDVNTYQETKFKDVYAGGDITRFPYLDEMIHMDHWEVAYHAGIHIAKNILSDEKVPNDIIPYFWSDQYDQTFEYLGHVTNTAHTYVRQYEEPEKFSVAYVDDQHKVRAVLFANHAEKRSDVESFLKSEKSFVEKHFIDHTQKLLD